MYTIDYSSNYWWVWKGGMCAGRGYSIEEALTEAGLSDVKGIPISVNNYETEQRQKQGTSIAAMG